MSDCLLILYWPDFRSSEAQYSPSAALVAHSLQRQLCLHHDDVAAYVWDPTHDGGAPPVSAFRRAGMRLLQDSPGTDTLVHLAWEHSQASRVVLAMDPARASEALPALTQFEREVEVWTPDASAITPAGNGASGAGVRVRELSEVLHLTTAHSVGFFADWRCLQDGLKRSGVPQDPAAGRESLLRAAELVGTLTTARFYGETEGFAAGDPQTRSPLNGSSEPAPPGIEQGSGPA
ncbi:MAG TPA: hypothetical protein VK689_15820, partial [Armatimonadota bacterium]|nr:hypothetical protein [Armatimonadota bacterium]